MKTILFIDNNLLIIENLMEGFELEGYKVLAANTGDKGIALAKQHNPDLIVSEICIGDVNGYDVLRSVNAISPTKKIPFIFCTTKCEKADKSRAMELGARDYVVKPFEFESLFKVARTWITHD